jgi:hypothetical protein
MGSWPVAGGAVCDSQLAPSWSQGTSRGRGALSRRGSSAENEAGVEVGRPGNHRVVGANTYRRRFRRAGDRLGEHQRADRDLKGVVPGWRLSAATSVATSRMTLVCGHGPDWSVREATYLGTALSMRAMSSPGSVTAGQ